MLLTVNSLHKGLANLTFNYLTNKSTFDKFLEKYVQVESKL